MICVANSKSFEFFIMDHRAQRLAQARERGRRDHSLLLAETESQVRNIETILQQCRVDSTPPARSESAGNHSFNDENEHSIPSTSLFVERQHHQQHQQHVGLGGGGGGLQRSAGIGIKPNVRSPLELVGLRPMPQFQQQVHVESIVPPLPSNVVELETKLKVLMQRAQQLSS
eukprot:PhM_4_TR15622/c3_g1_i2/m.10591